MLSKGNIDLALSMAIMYSTGTFLASDPHYFMGIITFDISVRIFTSLLNKKKYISEQTKDLIDYTSGGLIFAASFNYCKGILFQTLGSAYLERILATGFIPMLGIISNTQIANLFISNNENSFTKNNNENYNNYCLMNALKFTFFQGIKAACMPARYEAPLIRDKTPQNYSNGLFIYNLQCFCVVLVAYLVSDLLYTQSIKGYFYNFKENLFNSYNRANNSFVAAHIANSLQPLISSNFTTYDLLYSGIKKSLDTEFYIIKAGNSGAGIKR
ncbi:hypothetical protein [Candidatus Jidaibacter acanthamoebae]|nr:hypothetical protein [Candidatus Jidaibacter acanthamoeba]